MAVRDPNKRWRDVVGTSRETYAKGLRGIWGGTGRFLKDLWSSPPKRPSDSVGWFGPQKERKGFTKFLAGLADVSYAAAWPLRFLGKCAASVVAVGAAAVGTVGVGVGALVIEGGIKGGIDILDGGTLALQALSPLSDVPLEEFWTGAKVLTGGALKVGAAAATGVLIASPFAPAVIGGAVGAALGSSAVGGAITTAGTAIASAAGTVGTAVATGAKIGFAAGAANIGLLIAAGELTYGIGAIGSYANAKIRSDAYYDLLRNYSSDHSNEIQRSNFAVKKTDELRREMEMDFHPRNSQRKITAEAGLEKVRIAQSAVDESGRQLRSIDKRIKRFSTSSIEYKTLAEVRKGISDKYNIARSNCAEIEQLWEKRFRRSLPARTDEVASIYNQKFGAAYNQSIGVRQGSSSFAPPIYHDPSVVQQPQSIVNQTAFVPPSPQPQVLQTPSPQSVQQVQPGVAKQGVSQIQGNSVLQNPKPQENGFKLNKDDFAEVSQKATTAGFTITHAAANQNAEHYPIKEIIGKTPQANPLIYAAQNQKLSRFLEQPLVLNVTSKEHAERLINEYQQQKQLKSLAGLNIEVKVGNDPNLKPLKEFMPTVAPQVASLQSISSSPVATAQQATHVPDPQASAQAQKTSTMPVTPVLNANVVPSQAAAQAQKTSTMPVTPVLNANVVPSQAAASSQSAPVSGASTNVATSQVAAASSSVPKDDKSVAESAIRTALFEGQSGQKNLKPEKSEKASETSHPFALKLGSAANALQAQKTNPNQGGSSTTFTPGQALAAEQVNQKTLKINNTVPENKLNQMMESLKEAGNPQSSMFGEEEPTVPKGSKLNITNKEASTNTFAFSECSFEITSSDPLAVAKFLGIKEESFGKLDVKGIPGDQTELEVQKMLAENGIKGDMTVTINDTQHDVKKGILQTKAVLKSEQQKAPTSTTSSLKAS